MAMRSWVLKSWPEVHWQLPVGSKRWPVFQHMGTDIRPDRDEDKQIVGETVWAVRLDAGRVLGVAWEWVALRGHLPAVRDPNGFVTNGTLFDADGCALDELASIVRLNRVAHAVPWQGVVSRLLRGESAELVSPMDTELLNADSLVRMARANEAGLPAAARRSPPQHTNPRRALPLAA